MKYTLAVFDLDGTILDTLQDLKNSVNAAMTACGYPERTYEEVRRFVGNGIRNLIVRSAPAGTGEAEIDRAFEAFHQHYALHCADLTCPYPGVTELLGSIRAKGMKTAVVSNKADYAVQELCEKYFPGLFDFVCGEREGISRKPAPDSVNEVLSVLHIAREKAVYIGDSEVDVLTARNAEMDCLCVDWGFRDRDVLEKAGASVILSAMPELENALLA